ADIGEILVDNPEIHERMVKFVNQVAPASIDKLKLYADETPLFSRYQIENQIETAFSREVRLPSGGAIVFDKTEALVTIDENSALVCPRCEGSGHIRGVQSSALSVLRMVQEEAMKENTAAVHLHLPVETAAFLLNEKRMEVSSIESHIGTPIMIIPTPEL